MLGFSPSRRFLLIVAAAVGIGWACSKSEASEELSRELGPRIVSLHDVTSEIAVGLGLTESLVGIEELVDPLPAVRRDLRATPRVSSLESIVAREPTHVIGLEGTRSRTPELVAHLEQRGVQVLLHAPTSLRRSEAMLQRLAHVFHRKNEAQALGAALHREIAQKPPERDLEDRRPRVFVFDCCDPPYTAGGGGLLNEMIERAGGQNVFSDLQADWGSVSWEEVVSRNPELIVIHAYDYEGQKDVASKRDRLQAIPGLGKVPTGVLPLGCSLGGLRSVEGLRRLRAALGELSR